MSATSVQAGGHRLLKVAWRILLGYFLSYLGAVLGVAAGTVAGFIALIAVSGGSGYGKGGLQALFGVGVVGSVLASCVVVTLLLRLARCRAPLMTGVAVGLLLPGMVRLSITLALSGINVLGGWLALGLAPMVGRTLGLAAANISALAFWKRPSRSR